MPSILKEVSVLVREGKLHSRLVSRTRFFFIISLILLGVSVYFIVARDTNPLASIALAIVGYILGFFVFSHITPVQWNAQTEQIETGSLSALGWSAIGLYILFEIGMRTELSRYAGASAEGYILAGIFGLILGRTLGIVAEIHRVYLATHGER